MFTTVIAPLLSLILLEMILGIDNIVFISILSQKLPEKKRNRFRLLGISMAMISRLALLSLISWMMHLNTTLFTLFNIPFSAKDLVLMAGGSFLMYKGVKELVGNHEKDDSKELKKNSFKRLLAEVLLLDIVFSLDSIITAVGMADRLWIMYIAVIVSVGIMLFASKPISAFILKHRSFKILALCFLVLVGISLNAEALGWSIPKGYIYFSMAFALVVDFIQLGLKNKKKVMIDQRILSPFHSLADMPGERNDWLYHSPVYSVLRR
jgi:predicted tellurium resistance membrane protein TerC